MILTQQSPGQPAHTDARTAWARQTRKPKEASALLGIGERSVYALVRSGQLRSIRVGRKILIPLSAIEEFLSGTGGLKGGK